MAKFVTLLTDFGLEDSYVAEMKGVIYSANPDVTIVDITHGIQPGATMRASYVLSRTWHRFPKGTVHVAVVDPGVGSARRALVVTNNDHFFCGPDNGILSPILERSHAFAVPITGAASPTFHGRDVFAPTAGQLVRGTNIGALGVPISDPIFNDFDWPRLEGRTLTGCVIHIDRFGNLITNLPGDDALGALDVSVNDVNVGVVRRTFADVDSGDLVAYVGSGWTVEVARRNGSAAELLGVGVGAEVSGVFR